MTLIELIQQYRTEHDMSQRQFATECGLSNGYISMLERGTNPKTGQPITPTLVAFKKLAAGMHMSVNELFSKIDDMPVVIEPTPTTDPRTISDAELKFALFGDTEKISDKDLDDVRRFAAFIKEQPENDDK